MVYIAQDILLCSLAKRQSSCHFDDLRKEKSFFLPKGKVAAGFPGLLVPSIPSGSLRFLVTCKFVRSYCFKWIN